MSRNILNSNNIKCNRLDSSQIEIEETSTTALVVGNTTTDTFIVDTSTNAVSINGDLNVIGNAVFTSSTSFSVSDSLVQFANSNPADLLDIGFFGKYVSSGTKYAGLFRGAGTNSFILFRDATSLPNNTVSYTDLADLKVGNLTGTLSTASQPNITTLAGITSIGGSAFTNFANLSVINQNLATTSSPTFSTLTATNLAGTITTASQANITAVGTLTALTVNAQMLSQLDGIGDGSGGTIISRGFNSSVAYGGGISCSRARNTLASPQGVSTGDVLGGIWAKGYHSTGAYLGNTGAIRIMANETFTSTSGQTYIDFATTPTSSFSRSIRMIINGAGNVSIGASDLAGASYKLYTDGATYLNGALTINGALSGIGTLTSTTLRQSDGSNSTPSVSFTNDPNTGFYSYGADSIGVSLGGTGYQLSATTMTNVVGLYQSSAGFTTQNLTNLSSITGGNASIMGISSAYQWCGSCECTTSGTDSTASFELKLPVAATGGMVNYCGGTINGTISTYLVVGRIVSSTQTYVSISLQSNNIWSSSGTIYLNFSLQYRNE